MTEKQRPESRSEREQLMVDIEAELSRLAVGHPAWPVLTRCANALANDPVSERGTLDLLLEAGKQLQWTMLVSGGGHTVSKEWLEESQKIYRRIGGLLESLPHERSDSTKGDNNGV